MNDSPDIVARLRKSIFLSNVHHAFAQTDGTYAYPNSREGDMLKQAKHELSAAADEIERLRKERDEARRNLCLSEAADLSFGENGVPYHPSVAHKIAKNYGWDCFKEDTNG